MNELLKSLYHDENEIARWCPKVNPALYVRSERENKLLNELNGVLDEEYREKLDKLLDIQMKNYLDHGEEAFVAGTRTGARLVIEMITND